MVFILTSESVVQTKYITYREISEDVDNFWPSSMVSKFLGKK
jgi:signal recognition particle GTPase